jgi:hypothetical protein
MRKIRHLSHYTPRRRLGGEHVQLLLILDLGTVVSVTPRPRFSPGERTPGNHCTGGWVDPRAGLDTEAAGKPLSPLPGIEPRSPSIIRQLFFKFICSLFNH